MSISTLRTEVTTALRDFAWDQWAQLGVFSEGQGAEHRAADPEALLLVSFEVGRDDPRLFEEVLHWLVVNERLISVRRLRNLTTGAEDRALANASLAWVSGWRPRARLRATTAAAESSDDARPLFRSLTSPVREPDPSFLAHGFLKEITEPGGQARAPDLSAPICFAFRMRSILGVGARAEVMRVLLGTDAQQMTVGALAAATGFAKRNVQEALRGLRDAGVLHSVTVAGQQRFSAPRQRWAELLGLDQSSLPAHRDWPQLLGALGSIVRWLAEPSSQQLSPYMLSSEARTLAEVIGPDLRFAGLRLTDSTAKGTDYWDQFEHLVGDALTALRR